MLLYGIRALMILSSAFASQAQASVPFRDAFFTFAKMRQLEHRLHVLPYSGKEDAEAQVEARRLSAELTAARIDFHSVSRVDGKNLSPWEKHLLESLAKPAYRPAKGIDPDALAALQENFPKARAFTLAEWEVVREWFGAETEAAFFKTAYAARALPTGSAGSGGATVIWVRTFGGVNSLAAKNSAPQRVKEMRTLLDKSGFKLELIDVSPFAKADDQAAELLQALTLRKEPNLILLSQDEAGALVYRTLDLYPGLRKSEAIKGWVNLNGRLYGEAPPANRAPASQNSDPVNEPSAGAKTEAYRIFGENILRSPPLVDGFPIVNVVSLEGPQRLKLSPRESIVPEGSTWIAPPGKSAQAIPAALSLVAAPAHDGFRDNVSDSGF